MTWGRAFADAGFVYLFIKVVSSEQAGPTTDMPARRQSSWCGGRVHAELEGQVPDMTTWVAFDRIGVAADCAIQKVPMAKAVSKRRVYTMPHRLHVVG